MEREAKAICVYVYACVWLWWKKVKEGKGCGVIDAQTLHTCMGGPLIYGKEKVRQGERQGQGKTRRDT